MARVLITGFGPFLSYTSNPSGEIAEKFDGKSIAGNAVIGRVLPTEHTKVGKALDSVIKEVKPDIIISLGLAAGRGCISLERIALNRYYFRNGDEEIDEPLEKEGREAYFSKLPLDKIKTALQKHGIPAEFSFYPDTYVSNELFYWLMKASEKLKIKRAGFVHLPLTHKQVIGMDKPHYYVREKIPSMDEDTIEKAVRIIIETACGTK